MSQGRVICPACDKQYRFNTQLAGRKVKCKGCQSVIRMPTSPDDEVDLVRPGPQIAASRSASGYELNFEDPVANAPAAGNAPGDAASTPPAAGDNCPACNAPIKTGAVICISCGFNIKAGEKIKTAVNVDAPPQHPLSNTDTDDLSKLDSQIHRVAERKARQEESAADVEHQYKVQNIYAPLNLSGVGVLLIFLNAFVLAPWAHGTASTGYPIGLVIYSLVGTAVLVVIQVPLLLFGILIVSRLYGSSFGTLTTAMLKLIALAVMMDGVNDCIHSGLNIITGGFGFIGWMLRVSIVYVVFHALCASLFEMEPGEILVLFILMILVPIALMIVIGGLLLSLFLV